MSNQISTLLFGGLFAAIGILLIVKTWNVEWDEAIRALFLHPGAKPGSRSKLIGLGLTAIGLVTILAGLGLV